MNLNVISNAVRAIVQVIMKLNSLFDKERGKVKALEKALNRLGNPGNWFFQDTDSFNGASTEEGVELYYLCFTKGLILVKTSFCDQNGVEKGYNLHDLSDMSHCDFDSMISRLPKFLQNYQKFLEAEAEAEEITLDKLTKVVEAINTALQTKVAA